MKYADQLKNPMWQKRRLEVLSDNQFTCELCGDKETELHVHHRLYLKGLKAWEYNTDQLQCLCSRCHEDIHRASQAIQERLEFVDDMRSKIIVMGFLDGLSSLKPAFEGPLYSTGHALGVAARDTQVWLP